MGIGRGPGRKRAAAPSKRLRDAVAACSTAFNVIHDEMAWLIEHTPPGKQRNYLEALHAPFLALLDRYPARPASGETEHDTEAAEPQGEPEPKPS
jgi:hypothetical protein